jgi:hypothetical protein
MGKVNDLNLTEKQRSTAIKISEMRRQIANIKERMSKSRESVGGSKSRMLESDATQLLENTARSTALNGDDKMSREVRKLEGELENLESELEASVGHDRAAESRKRRLDMASEFDGGSDEEWNEILDLSNSLPEYPDIPRVESSENAESVKKKIQTLRALKADSQSFLSDNRSEKKLNELAQEEEDIDPLEAFMAENSIELANQQIAKAQAKVDAITNQLHVFEKLHVLLTRNQFSDQNLTAALEQRRKLEAERKRSAERPSSLESSQANRGKGTVWEDEFKKDETVPNRAFAGAPGARGISMPDGSVHLNASIGGLHKSGGVSVPVPATVLTSSQTVKALRRDISDHRQDELRKRLGY